jgi:hypothetical protein
MSSPDPFKISTSDVLGIDYSAYKSKIYAMALAKPSEYYKLREVVVAEIKNAAVEKIYDVIYNFLKNGKCGTTSIAQISGDASMKPTYPSSKINEIALGAAETLDTIIEKTIAIVLPANYDDIAQKKLTTQGQANLP